MVISPNVNVIPAGGAAPDRCGSCSPQGTLDPTGRLPLSVPVPTATSRLGQTFSWQALAGSLDFRLSNPATYVHDAS
ncbi:MAG: hypothetical protein AAF628_04245 [Planctomycetota bacterium]